MFQSFILEWVPYYLELELLAFYIPVGHQSLRFISLYIILLQSKISDTAQRDSQNKLARSHITPSSQAKAMHTFLL